MPRESMPAPFAAEKPKNPESREMAEKLGRKFAKLFKVLAIMGAVAVPAEACAPIQLSPLATEAGKSKADVLKRRGDCQDGIRDARSLERANVRQAVALANIAEQKFSACVVQSDYGIWDEPSFIEAQAALNAAKTAAQAKPQR